MGRGQIVQIWPVAGKHCGGFSDHLFKISLAGHAPSLRQLPRPTAIRVLGSRRSTHIIIWSTISRIISIRGRFLNWRRVSVRLLVLRRYRTRWRIVSRIICGIVLPGWRRREISSFREITSRWICSSGLGSYGYIRRW